MTGNEPLNGPVREQAPFIPDYRYGATNEVIKAEICRQYHQVNKPSFKDTILKLIANIKEYLKLS